MRIPIVLKLVVMTVLFLVVATGFIAWRSSQEFEKISSERERDTSIDAAISRADQVNTLIEKYVEKVRIAAYALVQNDDSAKNSMEVAFDQDRDIIALQVVEMTAGQPSVIREKIKKDYLKEQKLPENYIDQVRLSKPIQYARAFGGDIVVQNSSVPKGALLLTVAVPLMKNEYGQVSRVAVADLRLDGVQGIFARQSALAFFLVDHLGKVISHPNEELIFNGKDLSELEIVNLAKESTSRSREKKYYDPTSETNYMAAFSQTRFGPAVIAQAPESIILENAMVVRRSAYYITGLVISISIFGVFLFSLTLTGPIEKLVTVTRAIGAGNFEVESNVRTRDEVGELATSLDTMVGGLRERDKMRNVLNKFHGSSITDDLLKGDVGLGGNSKQVTVFFSDIRGFTKFSEGHTPEEVVTMLNEYFEIMVGIVTKRGGVVDKFIGDAMMAIWGAPESTGDDEYNCVMACLEQRQALEVLNKSRAERGLTPVMMGMGVNTGVAIAGTMGSSERMEYTVIGDTVNTASRIEASTKAFGTDLLISGETLEKIQDRFIFEYAGAAEVKGKTEPLKMNKVSGYLDDEGKEVIIKTEFSDYEAGDVDKVKVAS